MRTSAVGQCSDSRAHHAGVEQRLGAGHLLHGVAGRPARCRRSRWVPSSAAVPRLAAEARAGAVASLPQRRVGAQRQQHGGRPARPRRQPRPGTAAPHGRGHPAAAAGSSNSGSSAPWPAPAPAPEPSPRSGSGCLAACRTVPAAARAPVARSTSKSSSSPRAAQSHRPGAPASPRRPGSPRAARWLNRAPQSGPARSATRTVPGPRGALGGRREHQALGPDGRGRWSAPGQARCSPGQLPAGVKMTSGRLARMTATIWLAARSASIDTSGSEAPRESQASSASQRPGNSACPCSRFASGQGRRS